MKNYISILTLFITIITNAQTTVLPDITKEYCPNQEYTFTVKSLPGSYSGIQTTGGATVIFGPTSTGNDGKDITFTAKFSDNCNTQSFIINCSYASPYSIIYKKIKSLTGSGFKEGGNVVSQVVAPMCQTTSIPFSITGDQYQNTYETPTLNFGTINNYDYRIPAGWRLNGTLSTGSN